MDHIIHALKRSCQSLLVPHISDKESQFILIFLKFIFHDELFKLISGINNDLLRLIMREHIFGKAFAKGACSSGNENRFIIQ